MPLCLHILLASSRHIEVFGEHQRDNEEKFEIGEWLYCSVFSLSIFQDGNSYSPFAVYPEESEV